MADLLGAGYATLFVDGDVFFRSDPFDELFLPLADDSWDVQVQNEGHLNQLNIGILYMRATEKTTWVWREVCDRLQSQGGWDQDHFNAIMDSVRRRFPKPGEFPPSEFVTPDNLRVRVLDARLAWGFHFGWLFYESSVALHMTCCGTILADKLYIAAAYGALQDVGHYYTTPPRMLTLASLIGDRDELARTVHLVMAAARATGRAFLPPLVGAYLGPPDPDDGIVRGANFTSIPVDSHGDPPDLADPVPTLHRRYFWSLFKPSVLEDAYPSVAVLEPSFLAHSTGILLDRQDTAAVRSLHAVVELDLRPIFSFEMLIERLSEPIFADAKVVRISTDEGTWRLLACVRSDAKLTSVVPRRRSEGFLVEI
jgi:hypothetical protein